MDKTLRERYREMVQVDYFHLDQESRVGWLAQRVRAGEVTWSNNIRDTLCAAGVEDFVLLIGGPAAPKPDDGPMVMSYRSEANWSAAEKHEPFWQFQDRTHVIRRIFKTGGQRARKALQGFRCPQCKEESIRPVECCVWMVPKVSSIQHVRNILTKEYLL